MSIVKRAPGDALDACLLLACCLSVNVIHVQFDSVFHVGVACVQPSPQKQLVIPDFVAEHDAILEDQPLMDYGVVAAKELNSVPGLPGPM